jgi:uncharacterized membrane protein YbhN (UPF0104 family)
MEERSPVRTRSRIVRALLPFVVTAALFVFLARQIDFGAALAAIDARALWVLGPALVVYTALSLAIDALSLVRVAPGAGASLGAATAARIKAASYSFGLVHYALGAAALVVLLRRRGGLALADATGLVMLISAFDLLAVLGVAAFGSAFLATEQLALRAGLMASLLAAAPLGLVVLRSERSLGPLDRLRELRLMRSVRELPGARLAELVGLRALFVAVFIGLGGAALAAFGVRPPPAELIAGFAAIALVSALPIAVAGLGTGQLAFVYVFRSSADAETLLAASLALSAGIIAFRVALAAGFAREFAREALAAAGDAGR